MTIRYRFVFNLQFSPPSSVFSSFFQLKNKHLWLLLLKLSKILVLHLGGWLCNISYDFIYTYVALRSCMVCHCRCGKTFVTLVVRLWSPVTYLAFFHFQVMNVICNVWISKDAHTLHHKGLIAEFLGLAWVLIYDFLLKSPGVVDCPQNSIYKGTPVKYVVDVCHVIYSGLNFL